MADSPPLRLEWRTPSELCENPRNWRTHPAHQIAAMESAISKVGWAGALLYNEITDRLIDGHARKGLPLSLTVDGKVPVLIGSWTEDQESIILSTLDPIAQMAGTNTQALVSLLESIPSNPVLDLVSTPGKTSKLAKLLNTPTQIDETISDPPQNPISQLGDLWILGNHRVVCGDSRNQECVSRVLDGHKPFLMVTDPPYGIEYNPQVKTGNWRGRVIGDSNMDWRDAFSLFTGDVCYVWHSGSFVSEVADSLDSVGFVRKAYLVWIKPRFHLSSSSHYHWQHEPCWYAVRKGSRSKWCGDRTQSTVWSIDAKSQNSLEDLEVRHTTRKPLECMTRPIRNHGTESDSVYDPFLGSGTTLIAAENLGRVCFGLEIDPRYCDVIVDRWHRLTGKCAELIRE